MQEHDQNKFYEIQEIFKNYANTKESEILAWEVEKMVSKCQIHKVNDWDIHNAVKIALSHKHSYFYPNNKQFNSIP